MQNILATYKLFSIIFLKRWSGDYLKQLVFSPTAFLLLAEVVKTLTDAISLFFKTSNSIKIPPKVGYFPAAIYYTFV
ncbi:MAG: hypothetical protein ACR2KZ_20420 [Segetibacter sp.]